MRPRTFLEQRRPRPQGPGAPHSKIQACLQPPQPQHARHRQCQALGCQQAAPLRLVFPDPRGPSTVVCSPLPFTKASPHKPTALYTRQLPGAGARVSAGGSSSRVLGTWCAGAGFTGLDSLLCTCAGPGRNHDATTERFHYCAGTPAVLPNTTSSAALLTAGRSPHRAAEHNNTVIPHDRK